MDLNKKYYYTDSDKELSLKHLDLLKDLYVWRKQIILREASWKIYSLPHTIEKLFGKKDIEEPTNEMYKYFENYTTHIIMIQNLVGSNYTLSKAKELILKQVQFRVFYDIDNITPEKCKAGIDTKLIYSLNKTTKQGNGIGYFNIPSGITDETYRNVFLSFILTCEKLLRIGKKNNKNQCFWIYDLSALSLFRLPSRSLTIELIKFGNDYYPDSAFKIYMLFSPKSFRMIWKIISPILGEDQKTRMIFPNSEKSSSYETFKEFIHKENINKKSGGELEHEYSYDWEYEKWIENSFYL